MTNINDGLELVEIVCVGGEGGVAYPTKTSDQRTHMAL